MTGVNIKIRVANTLVLRISRVEVNERSGEVEQTDSEDGGFETYDGSGVFGADVTFDGFVRSTDLAPPVTGDVLPNVLIAWDGSIVNPTVNKRDYFTALQVFGVRRIGEVKGGIAYTLTCKSTGPFYPMGVPGP